MTFDAIVSDICGRLSLTTADAITRVGTHVNRRYRRVTTSIGLAQAFRRVVNVLNVTLATRVQTVTGMEKVISVVNNSVTNGQPLPEVSYAEMLAMVPTSGNPTCWAVKRMGASTVTLIFDTSFATAMSLNIEGEETATTLVGTQEPAFPESFHDVLIFGVLADEYRKKEKIQLARDADSEYERIMGELRLHVAVSSYKDVVQGKVNTSAITGSGGGSAGSGVFSTLTVNGAALFNGTAQFTNGVLEHGRSVAQGDWINPTFDATIYTGGNSLVWTVTAGQQERFGYMRVGGTLFMQIRVNASTLSGVADPELRVRLPLGLKSTMNHNGVFNWYVNSVAGFGSWDTEIDDTFIRFANGFPSTNWALNANLTFIVAQLFLEVH